MYWKIINSTGLDNDNVLSYGRLELRFSMLGVRLYGGFKPQIHPLIFVDNHLCAPILVSAGLCEARLTAP